MTQYFTNFGDYSTGSPPGDWTEDWTTSYFDLDVVTGGVLGTNMLYFDITTGGRCAAKWDDIGDVVNCEILCKVKFATLNNLMIGPAIRLSGGTSENGYALYLNGDDDLIKLNRYVNGTGTGELVTHSHTISINTWYWMRLRAEDDVIKAKIWDDGGTEPVTWDIDYTDPSPQLNAGGVGIANFRHDGWCDYFSVGTFGESAPSPIPSDTIVVYVTEGVEVAEVVTTVPSDINLSATDTITVTESITAIAASYAPQISIVDTVGVTESIGAELAYPIAVSDAVTVSEYAHGTTVTYFRTDPIDIPKAPTASGEITFEKMMAVDGNAPIAEGECFFGSVVEGNAPTADAEITLEGLFAGYIAVDVTAPTPAGTGQFGSLISGKAPTVSGEITLLDNSISVSGYAPVVSADITIPNYIMTVNGYSPFPTAHLEFNPANVISVDGKSPTSYGSMTITTVGLITVDGIAPVGKSTYATIQIDGSYISVTGTAPVVTVRDVSGEEDSGGFSISEHDRFDDVTLQYARWPDAV